MVASGVSKSSSKSVRKSKPKRGLIKFFKEVIAELKKVTWPTRKEWLTSTAVVIVVVVIVAAFIGVLDLVLKQIMDFIF
ncbi:MAG TPA: preprotein translocase subunit SecE [Clostridiales bacterium]|jgi:preprotein translocase subunit SecE|nr:preprotein translocase subunit SecE [Clostridiales bacterium]